MALEFGILGPLEVRSATGPIPLGGAKTRALLAALLLERNGPIDPERLAVALWGEDAVHGSGSALRVQISRLRARLGGSGVLVATAAGYELRVAPGAVDVDRFESLVAKGRAASRPDEAGVYFRAALDVWRGPALADVAAESFAQSAIARLEEQRLDALEARLDADLASGLHDTLVPELQQLTRRHPLRERLHRQLMLALYRSERQADALAAYRTVRTLLAEELGLEPGSALRDLERAILAHDPALVECSGARPSGHGRLVGRDRELEAILSFVRAGGGPRLVLVTGEAGIGKSALASTVAEQLPSSRVLYGRCDEEALAPFQPFGEALRDLYRRRSDAVRDAPELAYLLPELGPAPVDSGRHRLFEAVVDAIGDHALFVLDDLHWADAPTLTLLRFVLRRASRTFTVVATSRDAGDGGGRLGELAVSLRRDRAFERVRLAGLDVAATVELIGARSEHALVDPELVHARTAGNPFFIEQLLLAGAEQPVPDGIKELIFSRVSALTSEAGEALRIGAAIGADFELRDVEALSAEPDKVVVALDESVDAGLLSEHAGRFCFIHALARDAIYAQLSGLRRARMHQRIGEAFEARAPRRAAALAYHYHVARHVAGPSKAVEWALVAAGQAAAALAWEQEIALYESALRTLDECGSPDDAARCRILLALADRWVSLGGEHRAAYRRVAELAVRHGWSEILAEAATGMTREFEFGRPDIEGIALLERALVVLGEQDSTWRARVLARLADSLRDVVDEAERRRRLAAEALAMARRTDDGPALATALGAHCEAIAGPDTINHRLALIAESVRVIASCELDLDWELSTRRDRVILLLSVDPQQAFNELARLAERVAEHRFEKSYNGAQVSQLLAARAVIEGRLDDAERLAAASRVLFERIGDPDSSRFYTAVMFIVCVEQDRGDEIADRVAELVGPLPAHTIWRAARCRLDACSGRRQAAANELSALVANGCAAVACNDEWLATLVLLADAASDLKDPIAGATLARLLAPYDERMASFFMGSAPLGPIARSLARLHSMLGDREHAIRLLQRALAISESIPAPRWAARARADLNAVTALKQI